MAMRHDIGSLRPAKKLPDGRLRVDGQITRTGVFVYRNADGSSRREYRPQEEVAKADSLESFQFVPFVDDHPDAGAVDATNARKYTVGTVGESVHYDAESKHVIAPIIVHDAKTVEKMERGKVQLSCGYVCDVVHEAGVSPEGEHYDAIQRNIRGNHVALVSVGRAGPEARVRMDADDAIMVDPVAPAEVDCPNCAVHKARADAADAALSKLLFSSKGSD